MQKKPATWTGFLQALRNGWRNRCPRCGEGRIWNGTDLNEQCATCALQFEREKATWGGLLWSFFVSGVLIAIGIPLVELVANLSLLEHTYLWTTFTIVFHVALYRQMKAQWIGISWAVWDPTEARSKH